MELRIDENQQCQAGFKTSKIGKPPLLVLSYPSSFKEILSYPSRPVGNLWGFKLPATNFGQRWAK